MQWYLQYMGIKPQPEKHLDHNEKSKQFFSPTLKPTFLPKDFSPHHFPPIPVWYSPLCYILECRLKLKRKINAYKSRKKSKKNKLRDTLSDHLKRITEYVKHNRGNNPRYKLKNTFVIITK